MKDRGCRDMEKLWKKPKLVVLVRGRPEEAVLQGCKTYGWTGEITPGTVDYECQSAPGKQCVTCDIWTSS